MGCGPYASNRVDLFRLQYMLSYQTQTVTSRTCFLFIMYEHVTVLAIVFP